MDSLMWRGLFKLMSQWPEMFLFLMLAVGVVLFAALCGGVNLLNHKATKGRR